MFEGGFIMLIRRRTLKSYKRMPSIRNKFKSTAPVDMRKRSENVICKVKFQKEEAKAINKANYICFRPHRGYLNEDSLGFDARRDNVSPEKFIEKCKGMYMWGSGQEKHEKLTKTYDLMVSFPHEFFESEEQIKIATRNAIKRLEKHYDCKLDWYACVHLQQEARGKNGEKILNPHVHIEIASMGEYKGVSDEFDKKKDRFIRFGREERSMFQNWMKREMGMDFVLDEHAVENETRLYEMAQEAKKEWDLFKNDLEEWKNELKKERDMRILGGSFSRIFGFSKNFSGGRGVGGANGRGKEENVLTVVEDNVLTRNDRGLGR